MYLAVRVGKFVKQVVREWCPSATRSIAHHDRLSACTWPEGGYTSGATLVSCASERCLSRIGLPLQPVPRTKRAPGGAAARRASFWATFDMEP